MLRCLTVFVPQKTITFCLQNPVKTASRARSGACDGTVTMGGLKIRTVLFKGSLLRPFFCCGLFLFLVSHLNCDFDSNLNSIFPNLLKIYFFNIPKNYSSLTVPSLFQKGPTSKKTHHPCSEKHIF